MDHSLWANSLDIMKRQRQASKPVPLLQLLFAFSVQFFGGSLCHSAVSAALAAAVTSVVSVAIEPHALRRKLNSSLQQDLKKHQL